MTLVRKQRERRSLNAVLRHLAVTPSVIIETEEPDFLLNIDSVTVGVEVTELYLPSAPDAKLPEQAQENEQRLIIQAAQQQAIEKHVPAQLLQVRLSQCVLEKRYRSSVANELCNFIADHYAAVGKVRSFQRRELPAAIVHITLYGLGNEPHTWNGVCSGWVNSNFASGFQEAIDKKEVLRAKYLSRCAQCWLITVATHSGGSSFIEWSSELAAHQFSSEFDRVFFVQGSANTVAELQIVAGSL